MNNAPELIVREEIEAELSSADLAWIERILPRIFPALGLPPNTEASIVLTDDTEIRELNAEYRGIDETTDVLSFAYQEASDAHLVPELLGDIVISLPTARRYAEDAAHAEWIGEDGLPRDPWSFQLELAFLISHGFLHICGFDHEEEDEEAEMRREERILFEQLIGDGDPDQRKTPLRSEFY